MRALRLLARLLALALAGGVAAPALAALVDVPVNGVSCLLSVDVVRCGGLEAPTPTPKPIASPEPTTVLVGGCPRDARDLNSPLPAQPTLRGYDLDTSGRQTWQFCARPTVPGKRGGNLGVAWLDHEGTNCTQSRVRLVSFDGAAVLGGSTGWSTTPQLGYRFMFPNNTPPPGEYYFEVDTDSTGCGPLGGRVRVLWTHTAGVP